MMKVEIVRQQMRGGTKRPERMKCSMALLMGFALMGANGCFGAAGHGAPEGRPATYVIGPGDEISVHVLDSPDVPDKPVRVDPDGQISLPLIGRVIAANQTVGELEKQITKQLATYIIDPHVSINVTDFGSQTVSVLGAVSAPGIYQLSGPRTLAEVIALAKGLSSEAGGTIRVTTSIPPGETASSAASSIRDISVEELLSSNSTVSSIPIYGGDVITVAKANVVYVIGDVRKPGIQSLGNRGWITVLEAVSAAEGVLPTGSPQRARILRRDPKSSQRIETMVNIKRIMAGKAPNETLQSDDILVVPHNGPRAAEMKAVDAMISLGTGALIYVR